MIINRIKIENLYGYLSKDIEFNNDINLLVGINGSGKTSVLNAINWMIVPSIGNLCVHEFKQLSLWFNLQNEQFKLSCSQNEKELLINLKNETTNKHFNQIQADFSRHPKYLKSDSERQSLVDDYKRLTAEKSEAETWNFIFNKLPKPIVIGLDRQIYTEEGGEILVTTDSEGRKRRIKSKIKNSMTPLDKVEQLAFTEFTNYNSKILQLNDRLKSKLIMSSFDETLTEQNLDEILTGEKLTINQVETLEKKVYEYLKENVIKTNKNNSTDEQTKISNYFNNLKSVIQKSTPEKGRFELLYLTNLTQFRKLKELIKEFESFEKSTERHFKPIKNYLDTVNSFLIDSAKSLYFDKKTSKLKFNILNKENKIIESNRALTDFSSGEQQILILLTYIKFNSRLGKLFIIDEPELSLHPKWQEHFLEAIKIIMPSNTQLLFATHSPAIVGDNREYCKVLMPF
ncbi:MAG: AAA family ATPase [Cyclobacteriaceae bacterium]